MLKFRSCRRTKPLLAVSLALTVTGCRAAATSGRTSQDVPMSFPIHVRGLEALRLISPTESNFDDLARPMIGRIADRALKLKPMLVIVVNDSPQTVVAFSHKWIVKHQDG